MIQPADTSLIVSDSQLTKLIEQRDKCDDLIARVKKTRGGEPKKKTGKRRSAKGEVNEAQRKMEYHRERKRKLAEVPYVERTPEYQQKWDLYRNDLPAFIADNFKTSAPKPFGRGQEDSLARIQAVLLSGGRLCDVEPRGFAKSLALDCPLPTPDGWKLMGDIEEGDTLFDENGDQCKVLELSPVFHDKPCLKFTFSDRSEIICSDDHRWTVYDRYHRGGKESKTLTAGEMFGREILRKAGRGTEHRYAMPRVQPLDIAPAKLVISPYIFGAWLGGGPDSSPCLFVKNTDVNHFDSELQNLGESVEQWQPDGRKSYHSHSGSMGDAFEQRLRYLKVLQNGHIPQIYLRGSVEQRLALLQGLMDTSGCGGVGKAKNRAEFTTKSISVHDGFQELLCTFGIRSHSYTEDVKGVPCHTVAFSVPEGLAIFRLERKQSKVRQTRHTRIQITKIERVETRPTRCLMVNSPSHLFLAGRKMIPTHNTSKCALAALWSLFYGHRRCMPIFGSSTRQAKKILNIIKSSLLSNDELRSLNPWVMNCLNDSRRRRNQSTFQHCNGVETGVGWGADSLTMPTNIDEGFMGGTALVAPIKNARGMVVDNPVTGEILRPDFIFLDDVQTDEIAKKDRRVEDLEELIVHEALRLSGHHLTLAAVMTITCREPGDLAEKFLANSSWQSVRNKMLETMSKNEDMWLETYAEIRRDFKDGDEDAQLNAKLKATEFYRRNREKMDEGCVPGWEWCYGWADDPKTEISAIQHAYNIIIDDGREVFDCECQNSPSRSVSIAESKMLTVKQIEAKTSKVERFAVPSDCHTVVASIDVQERALYYKLAAFGDNYTGSFIDYGVWPEQESRSQTYAELRTTFDQVYPGMKTAAQIVAALDDLVDHLHSREYISEDGVSFDLGTILVDRGYKPEAVTLFCNGRKNMRVRSAKGVGIGPTDTPMEDRKVAKNERSGLNYQIKRTKNNASVMYVAYDTNFWKSQYHEGLRTSRGDPGCLTYYEPTYKSEHFQVACNDFAEYPVPVSGKGRSLLVWKIRPEKPDNHWFDAGVMCFVAASIEGIKFPIEANSTRKRAAQIAKSAPAETKSFAERLREGRNVFREGKNVFGG